MDSPLYINTTIENGLLMIEINRPEQLNALNILVLKELEEIVDKIGADKNIKSAFITGIGGKAFAAGADIKELRGLTADAARQLAKTGQDLFFKIENCCKPIIASINGFALGGGLELAMACHFRIASDNAKFGHPEVNLGLIPGYGGTQRLIRYIGKGKATEMMMTGDIIDAQEAHRLGLINHITTPEQLIPKTKEILVKIHNKAPLSIAKIIECSNAYYDKNGYQIEIDSFVECCKSNDAKEGIDAFLQKRPANFKGE
jgi:enoyl-CoA hydratase